MVRRPEPSPVLQLGVAAVTEPAPDAELEPGAPCQGRVIAAAPVSRLTHDLLQTSPRPRGDVGNSFASRRGHTSQLSISDPSHHVTEAIGTLYGDEDDSGSEGGRPLSFIGGSSSAYQDQIHRPSQQEQHFGESRRPLTRSATEQPTVSSPLNGDNGSFKKSQTLPVRSASQRNNNYDPGSPTLSLRDVQADSQFSLTDIDNPSDIAQELSNLQALRRMSMDVGNSIDPDMPPMSLSAMPAIAPSGDDDENDPSRLLWVPARVHPELAPSEFKSFLENRVHSIRRRSGSAESMLSPDGDVSRSDSGGSLSPGGLNSGSLRRKKSMLSRQIDNSGGRAAAGYVDGAERLERQRSGNHNRELSIDDLVNDPSKVVQKLTQESQNQPSGPEGNSEDMPILPVGPGMGLRRSTRTQYRKGGSLRSGEKAFSRRIAQRNQDGESAEATSPPPIDAPKGYGLTRVQSEPVAENYSRPTRSVRRQGKFAQEAPAALAALDGSGQNSEEFRATSPPQGYQDQLSVRISPTSSRDTHAESTLPEETMDRQDNQYSRAFPQRSTSQNSVTQAEPQPEPPMEEPPARSSRRPVGTPIVNQPPLPQQQYTSKSPPPSQQQASNENLAANLALPGSGSTRTDELTFIPTFNQDDKKDKKKKDRDDDSASGSSIKSGSAWKWFKGSDDKKKGESKKMNMRAVVEKAQDNARLDVIQTSIEKTAPKSRESVVLDRESIDGKLQEERKKESNRRSDSKREKDGSIFSSIFGGSKKKEEKEKDKSNKRSQQYLQVPEDPPYKPLQPDVDYHWSRFPLLEERAIYRMAHIKLANPRRPLHSQVLLSNFMYSYLAIVQAMHPQMNVPLSPQQKRLEEEARRKQQEEEYLAQQEDDAQQDLDQYNFDYHRVSCRTRV